MLLNLSYAVLLDHYTLLRTCQNKHKQNKGIEIIRRKKQIQSRKIDAEDNRGKLFRHFRHTSIKLYH